MDNILDILCDYSNRNKFVDSAFFEYVFRILRKNNEEYVKKIKARSNKSKGAGSIIPMSYSYFTKTIYYHPNEIENIYNLLSEQMESKSFSDLNKIFLLNSYILLDLLHEFEHVYQFDKVLNPDESVESRLLRLTFFPYTLVSEESALSKFLIEKTHFIFNDTIRDVYAKQGVFNKVFGTDILYERLADIYACEKMNAMLDKIDLDIDTVKTFFSVDLIQYLLSGYREDASILYPMVRYVREIKILNNPLIDEYIANIVIPAMAEVTNCYERFKFGLYVSDKEIKDLKKSI